MKDKYSHLNPYSYFKTKDGKVGKFYGKKWIDGQLMVALISPQDKRFEVPAEDIRGISSNEAKRIAEEGAE